MDRQAFIMHLFMLNIHPNDEGEYPYMSIHTNYYYLKIRKKQNTVTFYTNRSHRIISFKKYHSYQKAFYSLQRRLDNHASKSEDRSKE